MSVLALKTGMLVVLYLTLIIIIIAAFDKSIKNLVANEPTSQYLVMIVAVFAVTVCAAGIHGVYSGKRLLLIPYVFCNSLAAVFSLVAFVHMTVERQPQVPRDFALHCLIYTILGFIFSLVAYFNYHENERRQITTFILS